MSVSSSRAKSATYKKRAALLQEMTEARTDLNMFEGVVALLEGGTMSAGAQPYDFRIIDICREAQQKCLRRYDRARDALRDGR